MSKKRLPLILVLLVVLIAAGAYLYYRHARENTDTLHLSGNIETIDVEQSFRIAGWVQTRPVDEGEMVKEGQVVATLEPSELEHQVALAKAKADQAKWMLTQLQNGSRPEEIAAAEAAVREAEAQLNFRQLDLERVQAAFKQAAATMQELQQAEATHRVAAEALRQAQEKYTLVKIGPREEEIERAKGSLDQAQAELRVAQTRLDYATLHSPLTGMVLSKNTEPGEYVSAGTPIITVADLAHVYLRAYVDEPDLLRVALGQRATITTDAISGKTFEGRISFIASEAEFTPKTVQTEKERVKLVYRIKIDIDNSQLELKPGMPADADIALKPRD